MPNKIGFLFPGQGAQYVGMGKDLFEKNGSARSVYDKADQILGYSLREICFQGPEDRLKRTAYAQPAIFVTSLAALAVLKEKFPELAADFSAGLSLGEFSALTAAGAISFEQGLLLVKKRAEAMEACSQKYPGTMASILGLSVADCKAVTDEAGCELANLNSPDQIVISGTLESIDKACKIAEAKGAKRVVPLKVGGAFHSRLMQESRQALETALKEVQINPPQGIFIPNASAQKVSNPAEIRDLLAKQLTSPVRWIETMIRAQEEGIDFCLEIGPGKVLKGLAKRSAPAMTVEPCGTLEDIEKIESLFVQK
ncbi:MAG: ACP S-malonyltransferase [Candidatus Omnitrophica bacterium]|nr:ACP S-malonyltransferase [Candidatus Omnitrophota bacterium]